ncbi:heterokaryon incompatibility protein-domain-containing protein, partial [Schizothecium vesticola]
MEPFAYPPLPPGKDAIRILNIEPGDFYDDPIVCTLTSVTFMSKPRYLALSYTWDDAFPHNQSLPTNKSMTSVDPITINGQPFAIHHNLHLCLLHLRSKTAPLPLWVDAVCINQADADERNAQVALMSFIYPRAQAVVAWLG